MAHITPEPVCYRLAVMAAGCEIWRQNNGGIWTDKKQDVTCVVCLAVMAESTPLKS